MEGDKDRDGAGTEHGRAMTEKGMNRDRATAEEEALEGAGAEPRMNETWAGIAQGRNKERKARMD